MKAIIIALLAAFISLGCMAETAINLIGGTLEELPDVKEDPRRMPPVIPTAWFDGGTVYIHTTLPSQNVSVEITDENGIVAVQQITTAATAWGVLTAGCCFPAKATL